MSIPPRWLSGKASASKAGDPGMEPRFFSVQSYVIGEMTLWGNKERYGRG